MIKKFECGQVYSTRFITDYDAVLKIKIISRTEKTVTYIILGWPQSNKPKRTARPFIFEGKECIYPLGKYSMASTIDASEKHQY